METNGAPVSPSSVLVSGHADVCISHILGFGTKDAAAKSTAMEQRVNKLLRQASIGYDREEMHAVLHSPGARIAGGTGEDAATCFGADQMFPLTTSFFWCGRVRGACQREAGTEA